MSEMKLVPTNPSVHGGMKNHKQIRLQNYFFVHSSNCRLLLLACVCLFILCRNCLNLDDYRGNESRERIYQILHCWLPHFFSYCYFDLDLAFLFPIMIEDKKSWEACDTWLLSLMLGSSLCFQISEGLFQRHEVPGPGAGSQKRQREKETEKPRMVIIFPACSLRVTNSCLCCEGKWLNKHNWITRTNKRCRTAGQRNLVLDHQPATTRLLYVTALLCQPKGPCSSVPNSYTDCSRYSCSTRRYLFNTPSQG